MDDRQRADEYAQLQGWINKNLICLVLVYYRLDAKSNPKGQPLIATCSGFVMSFGDTWFFVSAGHVLKELNTLVAHPLVKVVGSFIVDSLGSQAKHDSNIPFSYESSNRHYVYEDGLDFGLVLLSPNDRRLLAANKIQPIEVSNWIKQDVDRCKGFILLGVPAELVRWESPEQRQIKYGSIMASLKRLRHLPEGAEETLYERFIGDLGPNVDLRSLGGTSGGPILGFYDHDGRLYYWVIALQSHCLGNRFIFGCPVKLFGKYLLDALRACL